MHLSSHVLLGKGSETSLETEDLKICAFLMHGKTFQAVTVSYLIQWDPGSLTVLDVVREIKQQQPNNQRQCKISCIWNGQINTLF